MIKKFRADELIFKAGLTETRTKAQAVIMTGDVEYHIPTSQTSDSINWSPVKKSGQNLPTNTMFRLKTSAKLDVGRGALKLREAFSMWSPRGLSAENKTCLDIGSSTGGFTQVLLENNAAHVVALDVGTHQLHEKIRSNPKVLSLENQHILKITDQVWLKNKVHVPFDLMVMEIL